MTKEAIERTSEKPFGQAKDAIINTFNQYSEWNDLEPEKGKKEKKTQFFRHFGRLFQAIPQLGTYEKRLALIDNPLVKVFGQYPDVGLILSGDLVSEERRSVIGAKEKDSAAHY